MNLTTPYVLPFQVAYQAEVVVAGDRDIVLRVFPAGPVSQDQAEAFGSTLLPFCFLATSGALAGTSIQPWTSTIRDWTDPIFGDSAIEWKLTSVNIDPQAWVMLAQMLLVDHEKHPISRIEILDSKRSYKPMDVIKGKSRFNPFPSRWAGVAFAEDYQDDISKNFAVCVVFSRPLSAEEQKRVHEELFAWVPGLMFGAYGVAPVPPNKCAGLPDKDLVFVDNELEWAFSNFKAHTFAIEGLINVLASISQKIVPVKEFRIE